MSSNKQKEKRKEIQNHLQEASQPYTMGLTMKDRER